MPNGACEKFSMSPSLTAQLGNSGSTQAVGHRALRHEQRSGIAVLEDQMAQNDACKHALLNFLTCARATKKS